MINFFITLVLVIISVLIIKEYIEVLLYPRIIKYDWLFWGGNLLLSALLGLNSGVPFLNLLLNICFVFYICAVGYNGYLSQKLMVSFSIVIIWAIVEIIVGYLSQLSQIELLDPVVQGSILSKLLTLLLVKIMKYIRFRYAPETAHKVVPKYWWVMIALPACSIVIVYYIFFFVGQVKECGAIVGGIATSCLFLPLNLGIFKIYDVLVNEYEIRQQNVVYEQYINQLGREMKEKEAALSVRHMAHDYKKHLLVMQQIAEKYQYKEIEHYYKGLGYHFAQVNKLIHCGNAVIDAMVNSKYSVAIKEGIQYEAQITIPIEMQFEDADICVILGNVLDNAYEAVQKAEEKIIHVAIMYSVGKLTIGIKNTYDGRIEQDKQKNYESRKKDKETHGFGIGIIKKVVYKYYGFMNIDSTDGVFTIIIVLKEKEI